MTEELALTKPQEAALARLEEMSSTGLVVQTLHDSMALAARVGEAREMVKTLMPFLMPLVGSSLGIGVDREYKPEQLVDPITEGLLRGYRFAMREMYVIGGRFYAGQFGVMRRVREWPGLTDWSWEATLPEVVGGKAKVEATIRYKLDGAERSFTRSYSIRVNQGQTDDAIRGKAMRKVHADLLEELSGVQTPTTDEDSAVASAKNVTPVPPEPVAAEANPNLSGAQIIGLINLTKSMPMEEVHGRIRSVLPPEVIEAMKGKPLREALAEVPAVYFEEVEGALKAPAGDVDA